jgi:uncharacterized protein YlxW (UPF0749 family)
MIKIFCLSFIFLLVLTGFVLASITKKQCEKDLERTEELLKQLQELKEYSLQKQLQEVEQELEKNESSN